MAAYQTQQVNVGSIAAPNVGQITGQFVDRINRQQSNQLDNIMQAAQFDRQQLLNQRVDKEYARGLASKQEIANIAKEYTNAPYAAKFGADEETKALDKRVLSMPQSTWENLTPEQAEALQAQYENVGQNKESARTRLMGELMKSGNVDYTAANAVAEDLTKGLMSRADKQAALDAQYKAKLEANKAYNDYVGNVNKDTVDIYKAKLDYQKAFGPTGTGGGASGSTGPALKEFNAGTTMDDVYKYIEDKSLGGIDSKSGREKVASLYNEGKGLHPAVILQALQNNTVTGGGMLSDNYINQEGLDQSLVGKKLGQEGLNELTMQLRNRQPMNLADPTRAGYVDPMGITRQIYNSTPDSEKFLAEALKNDKLAFLRTPEEQDKIAKAIAPVTSTNGSSVSVTTKMPESLQKSEGISLTPYKDTKGNVTVGVGYNISGKSDSEVARDFKEAGIDVAKINGLKNMDGTKLTADEVSRLTDVSYDRYGVQKAKNIGLNLDAMNPKLAEIAVSQVYRGDVVKDGSGYRGKLYDLLKDNDTQGMIDYVKTDKSLPKEVRTRLDNVLERVGPVTEEQHKYDNPKTSVKGLFNRTDQINATEHAGGVGDRPTAQAMQQKADRVKEINRILGEHPPINDETTSLINERAALLPKKSNIEAIQREILNPLSAMLPGARVTGVPGVVDGIGTKISKYLRSTSSEVLPELTTDVGRVVSGGSKRAILNDMYVPKIQELVSKPFTPAVKEELLNIAEKMPQADRVQIIRYIQRAERIN